MTETTGPADVDERDRFRVVHNDEEQYSIWAADRPLPAGWHDDEVVGTRDECLDHIERLWVDMRPRSLRERMAADGR